MSYDEKKGKKYMGLDKGYPIWASKAEGFLTEAFTAKLKKDLEVQTAKVAKFKFNPLATPIDMGKAWQGMQGKAKEEVFSKGQWKPVGDYISASPMSVTSMMAYDLAKTYGIDKTSYSALSSFLLLWMGLDHELYSLRKDVNNDLFVAEQTSMRYYGGPVSSNIYKGMSDTKKLIVPVQIGAYEGVSYALPSDVPSHAPASIKQFHYLNIQGKWADKPLTERSWVFA